MLDFNFYDTIFLGEYIMDKNIIRKLTHGMYVLTTEGGGCFVDAVCQISGGDNPLISVAVMKNNYTNELLQKNKTFALSIFGKNDNPEIIKTFGMNSMRNIDKFKNIKCNKIDGINVIEDSLGYLVCEIVDIIENDTHTLFIGKTIKSKLYKDDEAMTYTYYQEHKDDLLKIKTKSGQTAWVCMMCGYVYYGEEIPSDYKCPLCGVGKELFELK